MPPPRKKKDMKKIMWRLKVLPNAQGLAMLVTAGVLTPQEARQILIGETGETEEMQKQKKEETK